MPGGSELSVLEENELLKEICVVISFPLSSVFMIRELHSCSAVGLRNASIGYFPSTGYAWMSEEDKTIVNQHIHNEHYCSFVPNVWDVNHKWDKFTKDVVEIQEANKTRERFMVGVLGDEYLQKVLRDCGIPYWDLSLLGCTILHGDYDGVLIDFGNNGMMKA